MSRRKAEDIYLQWWLKIHSEMGEMMTRWLNDPEETPTIINKHHKILERCKYIESNSSLQADAPSSLEAIPMISYCCQGCQSGPHSPQSLSPNCGKVYFVPYSNGFYVAMPSGG